MIRINSRLIKILTILLVFFCGTAPAQNARDRETRGGCGATSPLNGVYRIDAANSDQLYSVIEGATSNVPYGEQQQFFNDLAVRLTPPDLLAIECRGSRVSLGSSRASRVEFLVDGATRSVRNAQGRAVRSRIAFEGDGLIFNSGGGREDSLSFKFTPLENGKRLRVTRRISAQELIEPVVIQTIYNKIGAAARWDIFGERQTDSQIAKQPNSANNSSEPPAARSARMESNQADVLRDALDQWIEATNRRDLEKQMSFYPPQLKAFYLARDAPRSSVRLEKSRAFAAAKSISIRAAEPEIVFQNGGQTAIMRFRKKYSVESGTKSRRGEVIQELRWQQVGGSWKIFSERDIKVIS